MKQSRLKIVWVFGTGLFIITILAIFKNMPEVAVIGATALAGIITKYIHDETKRKSIK